MRSKIEIESLLNSLLPLAQADLLDQDQVMPRAGGLTLRGELRQVSPSRHDLGATLVEVMIEDLERDLREAIDSGYFQAVGLLTQVKIRHPGGGEGLALRVELEHQDGYSLDVYFPYVKDDEAPVFGEPFAGKHERRFFG
jgi:hypothetical protein